MLWIQTRKAHLWWGTLAHLHQRNVTLHCWAHLRFMELLQGCAYGKQMGASWSSSFLLSFSHGLSFAKWLILIQQFTTSPNQTCHSATVSTHKHTWSSKLVTQPSFCLWNAIFLQHYPRWTLGTIPVTFSLSCGSSNHATHCVTFQSTSQHLPEVNFSLILH